MLKFVTGAAAKAGMALITGALTTGGGTAIVDNFAHSEPGLTIVGYILAGAVGGLLNWINVFFKRSPGYVSGKMPGSSGGLY